MIKKFIRWLIFGSSVPELRPEFEYRYFIRKGKPYKELMRRKS